LSQLFRDDFMKKAKVQNRSTKDDLIIKGIPAACADEKAAVEFMEKQRWGNQPACPCCGSFSVYQMKDIKTGERQINYRWRCHDCKKQYTVRTGTVFEDSKIPLKHWCFAFWRSSTSKKGVSALEIHRQTGLSYKSALFMLHRIRFAMSDSVNGQLCGDVEVDETYIGGKPRYRGQSKRGRGTKKQAVMALIERGGNVKTKPVANVTSKTLKQVIVENVCKDARIITDENPSYKGIGSDYAGGHESVCHSVKEYVRGEIHSNTVESFFAIVKRGLNGIYHAVSKEHLHRYLAEFEFRYNHRELEDGARTLIAIRSSEGKRLLYKNPRVQK
jgi:transposase-like protein